MSLINVVYNDKSATARGAVSVVGATVIKASRGGDVPVLFSAGQSKRILDYFGIPDVGNEAVDDIIQYNNSYPIWVSAPSKDGRYGGVLVSSTGTDSFIGGKTSKTLNFSEVDNTDLIGIANGVLTNYSIVIEDFGNYINQSIDILINGVSTSVAASDAEPEILTSSLGSGTYTRATGTLDFTFTEAPAVGSKIEVAYKTVKSGAYFAIFNKNPQVDDLAVKITKTTTNGEFVINLYKKSGSVYNLINGFPKTFSMIANTKNGFQQNIYAPVLFKDSDFIEIVVNENAVYSTFIDDTSNVLFAGGLRGTTSTAELTTGWDYFKQVNKYKADIFFDTTADAAIPNLFLALRNSYQKYAYYILPTTNVSYSDAITAYSSTMVDHKGIAYYWGWGKIINPYTGSFMTSSLMGRRALRLADMFDVFNGLAPAWFNENGTHGGQLGSGIIEMFFDADEDAQELLYQARINPTVMHPVFGVVNTRERTSQSMLSDYSSIGHVRLADYIVYNIITQALPYQLYKLNDYSHRTSVKSKIESIIAPTAGEPFNLLRDYIVKCDAENNNDEVLAREEFVVSVAVRFTPFSKYITLFFTNSAQGANVEEDV